MRINCIEWLKQKLIPNGGHKSEIAAIDQDRAEARQRLERSASSLDDAFGEMVDDMRRTKRLNGRH